MLNHQCILNTKVGNKTKLVEREYGNNENSGKQFSELFNGLKCR